MSDFGEEVKLEGGTLEFKRDAQGRVSMGIRGTGFFAMYQIAVGWNGVPLAVVPMMGV